MKIATLVDVSIRPAVDVFLGSCANLILAGSDVPMRLSCAVADADRFITRSTMKFVMSHAPMRICHVHTWQGILGRLRTCILELRLY